ncbi:hypothetical protein BSL78_02790 [Apostichopus japonicus]|uniref:Protein CUSTOS n=1 Tax=Stichopus japonicus TaxID=307972 RepID=A0A2G8LJ66_STIJA|nr:hypothetical protein BSL78_02790 [Apostichopus japonicus]
MAALKRKKHVHMNIESSSSSDEEERQKLQSSVWQPTNVIKLNSNCYSNTSSTNKPAVSQDGSLPPSKREDNSKSFNVTDDYRVTEMTPEYKSFVAKKLTTYLDDFLADVKDDESKWQSKVKLPEDDESFRLFSTSSNSYVPPKEKLPQAPWKSKKKRNADGDSLSSSDSDEERLRLEAVAVSADFIFRGARGLEIKMATA